MVEASTLDSILPQNFDRSSRFNAFMFVIAQIVANHQQIMKPIVARLTN